MFLSGVLLADGLWVRQAYPNDFKWFAMAAGLLYGVGVLIYPKKLKNERCE